MPLGQLSSATLSNQKGVGEWSVEPLQQLRDTGACSYLMALRARRRQWTPDISVQCTQQTDAGQAN